MSGQRFVDGVVDDFIDHVVQAGAVIGVADIHARPLAHGVEALQNPDRFRAIFDRHARFGVGNWSARQVLSCEAFEDVPEISGAKAALISLFLP